MIFFDRIQASLEFIDDHLDEVISLENAANASGFSLSHFYKVFLASTGFTVKEYIRNKRLARAATQLIKTDRRIIDIAFEAGFNSHEVFTRAFIQLYGISPKSYRYSGKEVTICEKYTLFGKEIEKKYEKLRDDIKINVKVIENSAFMLIGMALQTSVQDTIEKHTIPVFWRDHFIPRIPEIKYIKQPYVSIGYEIHQPETDELYHMACVEVTHKDVPHGMVCKILSPAKYVVFSTKKALNHAEYSVLIQYIYGEWLPMSGYKTSADFTLDMNYSNAYYSDTYLSQALLADSKLEVYIPVK